MNNEDSHWIDDEFLEIESEFDEKDEKLLRIMTGGSIVVDLNWFPEIYEYLEEEPQINQEILQYQMLVYQCMGEIKSLEENINDGDNYKKLRWNQEMTDHGFLMVPIEIRMVSTQNGKYPRFWGYICEIYPEEETIVTKKATISIPTMLFKRIEMHGGFQLNSKANPLKDNKVYMISAVYNGLQEFESDGEMRKFHKFWQAQIIEGYHSED
jgi:hypothetical protein